MIKKLFILLAIFFVVSGCHERLRLGQIEHFSLNSASLSLAPGEKEQLHYIVQPENATFHIEWSSSNESVATISQDGEVTAVAEGQCNITAKCSEPNAVHHAYCLVNVANVPVTSITLDQSSVVLQVGETVQLSATVSPDNATDQTVTWTTSLANIASVENGLVTALAFGRATVTASSGDCSASCTVTVPFSYGGMCLEAVSDGSIHIYNPNKLKIQFLRDSGGNMWQGFSTSVYMEVSAGERVWFRGQNESYAFEEIQNPYINIPLSTFLCSEGEFYLYGNLMSLLYGDEYESKNEIKGVGAFYKLFANNSNIINHPTKDIELPATTLSQACYMSMFEGCTQLTRAPRLPAKILTEDCYYRMFDSCTSLKEFPDMSATDMGNGSCFRMMSQTGIEEVPELPSMHLVDYCYEAMFLNCPNLRKGPSVLPATDLALACYAGMFFGCEKLEEAPVLPATILRDYCYYEMFDGCSSLKYIKMMAVKNSDGYSDLTNGDLQRYCKDWVNGVSESGTFVKNPEALWDVKGPDGIPEGWTIQ